MKERLVAGNAIRLLKNGEQYFPALESAIDRAEKEIFLETYIYEVDRAGISIGDALMRAAARGVSVHLLIDGFGSRKLPESFVTTLKEAGVEVLFFSQKISPWTLRRSRLRRLHRKLSVFDGKRAFVGGINIIDDRNIPGIPIKGDNIPPRFDYSVEISGPLVADIHHSVKHLWMLRAWMQMRKPGTGKFLPETRIHAGNQNAAFIVRDNFRHRRNIELAYLRAIASAKREIVIANAYFFPGISFRHALVDATSRGVRVVLLLQGKMEYLLLHYATRALYGKFLDSGIEIYEYHRSLMHAKVAVIDGHWTTIGSSNIDPFSLLLAREANVVIQDESFAAELREDLEKAIREDSKRLLPDSWEKQPLSTRFMTWLSYGMVRFLTGMAGYGRDHEFR
ncbi:MAG: cardiolipin synthase ClsB [Burkholderiales bacterium]|nr:cardiolipin synthase ClsB [Burkholderiales bacterium]